MRTRLRPADRRTTPGGGLGRPPDVENELLLLASGMNDSNENSNDPAVHSEHLQARLAEMIDHMRADISRVSEAHFQALLETSAEVLGGLRTAFQDYDRHQEPAWRKAGKA